MASQWFYSHDGARLGPCTDRELRDLAEAGDLVATDTVWKAGVDQGVLAARVKSLFPVAASSAAVAELPAAPIEAVIVDEDFPELATDSPLLDNLELTTADDMSLLAPSDTAAAPQKQADAAASQPGTQPIPVKKGRATGIKGVVIVGQDGESVRFKKKCVKCGTVAGSANKMPIKTGVIRTNFFCPKCRKSGEVIIQCMR